MAEPQRRVERSVTTTGHEVFSPIWALALLGALRNDKVHGHPVHPVKLAEALVDATCMALALPEETRELSREKRKAMEEALSDRTTSAMWTWMYSGNRVPFDVVLQQPRVAEHLVVFAAKRQLFAFVDAMIVNAAARRAQRARVDLLSVALLQAAMFTDGPRARQAASQAYEAWCIAELGGYLNPDSDVTEEGREGLRWVVDHLDGLLSPVFVEQTEQLPHRAH